MWHHLAHPKAGGLNWVWVVFAQELFWNADTGRVKVPYKMLMEMERVICMGEGAL